MPKRTMADQETYYVDEGEGDALLLLPDNALGVGAYGEEIDHLAKRFRVIAMDPPGSGQSTREVLYQDEIQFDPWNFRADLACHLLQELGVTSCVVVGAGFAALTALHFAGKQAALHQIDVTGAVADSFLPDLDARTLHRWLDVREHFYLRRVSMMEATHGKDWRDVVDADEKELRQLADRGGYRMPEGVLRAIQCPVLLTGSARDQVTPGIARQYAHLAETIPEATIHLVGRSYNRYGDEHPFIWTAPDAYRRVVDAFLEKLSSRG